MILSIVWDYPMDITAKNPQTHVSILESRYCSKEEKRRYFLRPQSPRDSPVPEIDCLLGTLRGTTGGG